MKFCLIGIISWCDSKRFPERFKIFKRCVAAIKKYIPKELCYIVIVDNNSSEDVRRFIRLSPVFDKKVLLPENLHDTGALAILARICRDLKVSYFFPLDNDHIFFRKDFLPVCLKMLNSHRDCGFVRLLKFEYKNKDLYDKGKQSLLGHDKANERWLYNIETNKPLIWEGPFFQNNISFYVNNWHWATCGPLVRIDIWNKIFPKIRGNLPIYYDCESLMRKNYQKLGFKVLVLDGGAFSQMDKSVYQAEYSSRKSSMISDFIQKTFIKRNKPFITAKKVKYYLSNYQRYLN